MPAPIYLTSIPYLSFNYFTVNGNRPRRKFHSNSALAISIELVRREPHQQIRFTNPRVTN